MIAFWQLLIYKLGVVMFCRQHQIRRLALFGPVLRDDFGPDSNVDLLVEFANGVRPGLFTLGRISRMQFSRTRRCPHRL